MSSSVERALGKGIQLGTVFAEVGAPILYGNRQDADPFQFDPISKTVFGVANAIFEVRALY